MFRLCSHCIVGTYRELFIKNSYFSRISETTRKIAPIILIISAKLKKEDLSRETKSITYPNIILSMRFDKAPVVINMNAIRRRFDFVLKQSAINIGIKTRAAIIKSKVAPGKMPNTAP